jgi:hypothetical protein
MKSKDKDALLRLKYIAYCTACMPEEGANFFDFVRFCKFRLCAKNNILLLDAIWDKYTDEEIIIEYYAMTYALNPQDREDFLNQLKGDITEDDDMIAWMDSAIEQNKKDLTEKFSQKENISFKPVIGE